MPTAPQVKIGLLNDLHYDGSVAAMNHLYENVAELGHEEIGLLVVLGDLIDASSEMNALRLLREVSALCNSFSGKIRYMPGNHDLDHLSKTQFYSVLDGEGNEPISRFQHEGVDCICIDGNYRSDGTEYAAGNFTWEDAFVPEKQLDWLRKQLDVADAPVVIFTHQRIDIESDFSVQNHAAVRDVIRNSGKVKAVFQGHQHADDLQQIEGTTYYTLSAHVDDAGPAVVMINSRAIQLFRHLNALENV